jgi:hypothetical protein
MTMTGTALGVMTNAIIDAVSPHGVTDINMPASSLRVWKAIHGGAK